MINQKMRQQVFRTDCAKTNKGYADLFVISAKAEIQCIDLTGFPPARE
jgi:hypothetical protein